MFGLSFGEVVVLLLIAIVVVGPRELPRLLRTIGEFIGHARRMATELRAESGIDEILRDEGIQSEIDNFRKLASGVDLSAAPPKYDYPPPPAPEDITTPEGTAATGILTQTSAVSAHSTEADGPSAAPPQPSPPQPASAAPPAHTPTPEVPDEVPAASPSQATTRQATTEAQRDTPPRTSGLDLVDRADASSTNSSSSAEERR